VTKHARNSSGSRRARSGNRHARGATASGGRAARRRANQSGGGGGGSFLFELSIFVPMALVIAIFVKTFLGQAFYVPSGSMKPTIFGAPKGGDRVVVNKLTARLGDRPQRGEVVVFRDELGWLDGDNPEFGGGGGSADTESSQSGPVGTLKKGLTFIGLLPAEDDKNLIKRVIGLGGDQIACSGGKMQVNGVVLEEDSYVNPEGSACTNNFSLTVPQGRLFVMGDNREESADSAFHVDEQYNGTVSETMVVGPAVAVALPPNRFKGLPIPEQFGEILGGGTEG
jgi:signal peptidase I